MEPHCHLEQEKCLKELQLAAVEDCWGIPPLPPNAPVDYPDKKFWEGVAEAWFFEGFPKMAISLKGDARDPLRPLGLVRTYILNNRGVEHNWKISMVAWILSSLLTLNDKDSARK